MVAAVGLIFLVGCGRAPEQGAAAIPVRVEPAALAAVTPEETYTGTVRARWESDLGFRVGGKIVERQVDIGDRVTPGQTLARLDPTDYEAALRSAEAEVFAADANLRQTRSDLARYSTLAKSGWTAAQALELRRLAADQAKSRLDQARALLQIARDNLAYTELKTDAEGVVTATAAEIGQVVTQGQLVLRVARPDEREVWVGIPENRIGRVGAAEASISLWSAGAGPAYPAKLREVGAAADPVTRTYLAKFSVPGAEAALRLGMTGTVHLAWGRQMAIALPASALFQSGEKPAVWIVDKEKNALRLAEIEVRRYGQDRVIVASGIDPGDLVVTAGVHKLDLGTRVRIAEAR